MTTALADDVRSGDRRALARAITLVESGRPDHRIEARALLDELLPRTGHSARIGLSGAPGAGKSTLIESLGVRAIEAGQRVAVLAVDPSSGRSGGSILGDKTRMANLSKRPEAFIRPSPTGGVLGGVARGTREAILLCEAARFDVVLVETVGVGQSEVAVADLVDLFVLVASPAGGDQLQGIKRGIMELADLIVVNKADGELLDLARRSAGDLRNAVHLLRPKREGWEVPVLLASAVTGHGMAELWETIGALHEDLRSGATIVQLRADQAAAALWDELRDEIVGRFLADPAVQAALPAVEAAVRQGTCNVAAAVESLLKGSSVNQT